MRRATAVASCPNRRPSEDHGGRIATDFTVRRDEREVVESGLDQEEPVERVPMYGLEALHL